MSQGNIQNTNETNLELDWVYCCIRSWSCSSNCLGEAESAQALLSLGLYPCGTQGLLGNSFTPLKTSAEQSEADAVPSAASAGIEVGRSLGYTGTAR
jgi:hypothetical protein